MKKTISLLAALMLIVMLLPVTAMAYDKATLTETTFDHKLELTYALNKFDRDDLVIAYKYTVGSALNMQIIDENQCTYAVAKGVQGSPAIIGNYTDVSGNKYYALFNNSSSFDANKTATVELTVDWSDVSITEPGIYLWEVTKELDETITTNTSAAPTDKDNALYLYAIVTRDSNDILEVKSYGISKVKNLSEKSGNVADQYPAKTVNLTIKKEIAGNMASTNQYFSFEVVLNSKAGSYDIEGTYQTAVPETVYNGAETNNTSFTVPATGKGTDTFWLKHDQYLTIKGLPYGSNYTIVEGNNAGYTVAATVTGDTDATTDAVATDYTVSDTSLTNDSTVTYTNEKNVSTPTGITLNTAAPVMGILLAMSLLAVMYLGKRKEYQA